MTIIIIFNNAERIPIIFSENGVVFVFGFVSSLNIIWVKVICQPGMDILIYFYILKYIKIYFDILMMMSICVKFDYHLDGDEFQP